MGAKSNIEWTGGTWTPIRAKRIAAPNSAMRGKIGWHCEHVSEGCRFCYAETLNKRLGTGLDFKPGHRKDIKLFLDEKMLTAPLRWKKPRRIFVCSMTDLFADFVKDEWIDRMFAVMALCPQHTFQILTKRPERMRAWFAETWQPAPAQTFEFPGMKPVHVPAQTKPETREHKIDEILDEMVGEVGLADPSNDAHWTEDGSCRARQFSWPLPNVWLGTSCEDQDAATARIPHLKEAPAAVRFISFEPLLGTIEVPPLLPGIDWAIIGGESGPGARPNWTPNVRKLVKQCHRANVAVFVKQMGANVQDRNDAGFEGCSPQEWPDIDPGTIEHDVDGYSDEAQGAPCRVRLKDRKGGDMDEWPEDLRVREYPKDVAP